MNIINWDQYKFHCSSLSYIMGKGRSKFDLLSETAKSYLLDIYVKEVYGRQKSDLIANKYVRKGTMCETDSLMLFEKVTGKKFFKNKNTLSNDYIVGTPDVYKPEIIDIKTSWDIFTFAKSNKKTAEADYYYQLLGYMWLTGQTKASLVYCLVDTPSQMVNDEILRLCYYIDEEEADKYRNNYEYSDIEDKDKVKMYEFNYEDSEIEKIMVKIFAARNFLKSLTI